MARCRDKATLRRELYAWFDSPLGRSLQAIEVNSLRDVLPALYGTVAVQLGRIGKLDMLDASVAPTRILLDLVAGAAPNLLRGAAEDLPFDAKSIDLALLPHTLDFSTDPHQVLREVSRVLAPEGHVVILGFNPVSLWGVRRLFTRHGHAPWCANFFRLGRIKDWLALLDFECTHGAMLYYRPPIQRERVMERLYFLDKAGNRWWPMMAAVYVLVAKKRVVGVTPLRLRWRRPALRPGVTEPVARGLARAISQERVRRYA